MRIPNDLAVRPLKHYEPPRYPTLAVHTSDPAFVIRHIPRTWTSKSMTLSVFAAYALASPMALADGYTAIASATSIAIQGQTNTSHELEKAGPEDATIAPVFIHGHGRGAVGCVVISAPVFLGEDDAMEIVLAELRSAGLTFDERDRLLPGMEWDRPLVREGRFFADDQPVPSAKKPFTAELYNSKMHLAIKLITVHNYQLSGGALDGSSVSHFDLLALAQKTVERLQASSKVNAVVFYDPLEHSENRYEEGIARARGQLRAQVQDFLLWLKARRMGAEPQD